MPGSGSFAGLPLGTEFWRCLFGELIPLRGHLCCQCHLGAFSPACVSEVSTSPGLPRPHASCEEARPHPPLGKRPLNETGPGSQLGGGQMSLPVFSRQLARHSRGGHTADHMEGAYCLHRMSPPLASSGRSGNITKMPISAWRKQLATSMWVLVSRAVRAEKKRWLANQGGCRQAPGPPLQLGREVYLDRGTQ